MDSRNIIVPSLAGKINLPRFGAGQNELMKHVLPALPFMSGYDSDESYTTIDAKPNEHLWETYKSDVSKMFFPLALRRESDTQFWMLPYEPFVTVSGNNNIVKRNVSKAASTKEGKKAGVGGTIKERWSQDDYTITITGMLAGAYDAGGVDRCYPKADFRKLHDYLTAGERIEVECIILQELSIHWLVVESFTFPFTKGESMQAYEIQCVSDSGIDLLEEMA